MFNQNKSKILKEKMKTKISLLKRKNKVKQNGTNTNARHNTTLNRFFSSSFFFFISSSY
jgi:hypothetical protein